jgi:hypothetical protein
MRVAQQSIHLTDRTLLVAGDRPDLPQPFPQPMDGFEFGGVMVAPPSPAEPVQIGIQRRQVPELLTLHPITVDQHTRGTERELGVMTEKHLTHDPLPG